MTLQYKVARQGQISDSHDIDIPDPKNHGNKKIHVSSMYRSRDKEGHLKSHVTLTYKVTRQDHVSGLHAIDFLDPKNL